jgi:hypothetical protein
VFTGGLVLDPPVMKIHQTRGRSAWPAVLFQLHQLDICYDTVMAAHTHLKIVQSTLHHLLASEARL